MVKRPDAKLGKTSNGHCYDFDRKMDDGFAEDSDVGVSTDGVFSLDERQPDMAVDRKILILIMRR